jgi:hypothetical protein
MGAGQNTLTGSVIRSRGDLVGEEKHTDGRRELVSHTHVYDDTAPYNSGANQRRPVAATYYGTQTNPKPPARTRRTAPRSQHRRPIDVVAVWIKT